MVSLFFVVIISIFFYNLNVKKIFLIVQFLFLSIFINAQNAQIIPHNLTKEELKESPYSPDTPQILKGIWQGSDRLILFAGNDAPFTCILRVFYQWYDDKAAEPSAYSQISTRDRNNTTSRYAENITVNFKTIAENTSKTAGAYELEVKYPGLKEKVYIPLAVVNNSIYLKFYLRKNIPVTAQNNAENIENYYLTDLGAASGITISPPVIKEELLSYFVQGNSIYHIRYWLSQMSDNGEMAEFSDGDSFYQVNKFINTAGRLYTCTTGRSSKIRNIQKSSAMPQEFVTDEENLIYAYGKPYLAKVPEKETKENLDKMVEENNKRRHPPLKPLFPVSDINFHWKEITELEKYNPYTWNRRNLDIHK